MTFGKKLRMIDRIKGISQADIRRGLDQTASAGAISNWFNEKYMPDGDVCLRLARFLDVPLKPLMDTAITEEEFEKVVRGRDERDPAERAMQELARIFGWQTLVERVTSISHPAGDSSRIIAISDPTKPRLHGDINGSAGGPDEKGEGRAKRARGRKSAPGKSDPDRPQGG